MGCTLGSFHRQHELKALDRREFCVFRWTVKQIKLPSGQGQCLRCGKTYFNVSTTNRHYRTVHAPAKKLTCPICQKVLTCEISRKPMPALLAPIQINDLME